MIEFCPALLLNELLFLKVVPEVAKVICPAPNCTTVQLNPAGKLDGKVNVKADATFILIILPLSVEAKE